MTSIQNFSNYLIYNNGDIYSVKRNIFLKPRYDKNGYARVGIVSDDKKNITLRLHQLVCMAYLDFELEGTSGSKLVIDHIDNNKNNNYLHNLQIITREQNSRKDHKNKTGLLKGVYRRGNKFYSSIKINKQNIYLGTFNTELEAHFAYKTAVEPLMQNVIT
jgi:hypothetical protein